MRADAEGYENTLPLKARGQKVTRRLLEQYGASLVCVRYRYDEKRGVRLKTVEIIVEEKPMKHSRFKDGDIAPVLVNYDETELREQLRKMRARWSPEEKLWYVPYRLIRGTELEKRISEQIYK